MYKGHKVVPYCPRCGTALSSHEVAQGYQDVTETSIFVRFRVTGEKDTYLLAWTTTPWTLPSNVALCVNPEENYAYAQKDGQTYILAQALVETLLGEGAKVVKTRKGKELAGLSYDPLFDFQNKESETCFTVAADGYVTLDDGSGIVHIAPAFGEDDARVGRAFKLPFVQRVDEKGNMDQSTPWAGMFCKDADPLIIETLKKSGLLFKEQEYTHNYPFCWRWATRRCSTTRAAPGSSGMTAVRDALVKSNQSVNWLPENIRDGRMGNFVENVIDWGLSRERYWGTPLPIWTCECGHVEAVGGIADLKARGADLPDDLELHKPYIDRVTFPCPKCNKQMHRVSEVIGLLVRQRQHALCPVPLPV